MDNGTLNGADDILEAVDVETDQLRSDVVPDGTDNCTGCIAGDDAGRRSFSVALFAGVRKNFHNDIIDGIHCAQCGFEGHAKRDRNGAEFYLSDFHGRISPFQIDRFQTLTSYHAEPLYCHSKNR